MIALTQQEQSLEANICSMHVTNAFGEFRVRLSSLTTGVL